MLKRVQDGNKHFLISGKEVKVKPAKTKRQMHRNWAVNQAVKLIKADPLSNGEDVAADKQHGLRLRGLRGRSAVAFRPGSLVVHDASPS